MCAKQWTITTEDVQQPPNEPIFKYVVMEDSVREFSAGL